MGGSNAQIIRKAYDDFAKGDVPAVFAVLDARMTWQVPGHGPLAGVYTGHEQIGGFFARTMELSAGTFSIKVHNVLADGDLVVVLVTVSAERNGASASFAEVHVWRMRDSKVIEFREFQGEEQREDHFWS
jgi:uncharacterized protein